MSNSAGYSFLGYRNRQQLVRSYTTLLSFGVVAFIIRLSKWSEVSIGLQIGLFITSMLLISALWESLRAVNRWMDRVCPFERSITRRILIQILCGIAIGLSIRTLVYYFGEPYVPFKLDSLYLATTWVLYAMIPTVINLGFFTSYFITRWKDSLLLTERLEKEKSQVQFDNLKNQLNPHFLFNALTSLNTLIFEDQALASQFLQQLSKVYRYLLQNKDKNFVSLQTELDFIQHYIFLLNTRFAESIDIRVDAAPDLREQAIVPVTLQILIENALKHNIADREKPLRIVITAADEYLTVSNNFQPRQLVETSNKQGLENLKSLYSFLTDRPIVIEHTSTTFTIRIPLL